jgi:hypothetical protein
MTPLTYDERASALTKTLLADAQRLPRRLPSERTSTAPWKAIAVFAATVVVIGGAIAGVSIALRSGSAAQSAPAAHGSGWRSFGLKGVVGGLSGVSCVDSSYCVAVDHDGHLWASTNPGGGPAAWKIIADSMTGVIAARGKAEITGVSCARDPSRCEAMGQGVVDAAPGGGPGFEMRSIQSSGEVNVFDTIALGAGAFINRNSCAGTLCVMVGSVPSHVDGDPTGPDASGYIFATTVFNGIWANAAYGNGTELPGTSALTTVSCASASFCVAADTSGALITSTHPSPIGSNPLGLTLDPSAWSVTHAVVPAANSFTALSCPSVTLCVAITRQGDVVTSTDPTGGVSAWKITRLTGPMMLESVSCASRVFCVIGGASDSVFMSRNPAGGSSSWTETRVTPQGSEAIVGVSCPSAGFCVAVDGDNGVHVLTKPSP